jgi:hypothetical protein
VSSPPASASSEQPAAAVEPPVLAPDEHAVPGWARRLALERVRTEASEAPADATTNVPGVSLATLRYLAALQADIRNDPPPPRRMRVSADVLVAALPHTRRFTRLLAFADVSPGCRREVRFRESLLGRVLVLSEGAARVPDGSSRAGDLSSSASVVSHEAAVVRSGSLSSRRVILPATMKDHAKIPDGTPAEG